MNTTNFQAKFATDARLFPHLLDVHRDRVLISELSESDFEKASFLDQRIFAQQQKRWFVEWEELAEIELAERQPPNYIFHIGHVGSTLISRLLGQADGVFALREPLLLRSLAENSLLLGQPHCPWQVEEFAKRRRSVVQWLSRSFRQSDRAMIKASSFVSEISRSLLEEKTRALFMFVPLQSYMTTILAGEASMDETLAMAGTRLQRLNNRLNTPLANLSALNLVQRIAMSWLCETACLLEAQEDVSNVQIQWMNFDTFLDSPHDHWQRLSQHFAFEMPKEETHSLLSGPIMTSYSKAPEHGYSSNLR